uniref:Cyclin-dependent kinase 3 n=1 Tax=Lygus hesperus TaxID=30085 RepID=A0A0A9XUP3_LYGHE
MPMSPNVVTLWYRSPELLLDSQYYHTAIDIWSIGCIFGELVLHQSLFPGSTEVEQFQLICDLLGTPTISSWPGLTLVQDLCTKFLTTTASDGSDGGAQITKVFNYQKF